MYRHFKSLEFFFLAASVLVTGLALAGPPAVSSNLLQNGRAALEDELYDIASVKLQRYLQEVSRPEERSEGLLLLAQAMHGQKRYQDLLELLKQNRLLATNSPQADAFEFWRAFAHFERGEWDQTVPICRALEQHYPLSPYRQPAIRLQAWSLAKQGQTNAALVCFARFAEKYEVSPEGPANRLDWAELLMNSGRFKAAREVLEQMPAINPETPTGQEQLSMLGSIYLQERAWSKARAAYTPLIRLRNVPDEYRAGAFLALAEIAVAETNPVEALSLLDQANAKLTDPAWKEISNLHKGKLLLKMNKLEEGIALIRGFVAGQATNALARQAQLELAQALLDQGHFDKALVNFQNYLETFSDPVGTAQAQQGKGRALSSLGRYNEAATAFEKAALEAPSALQKAFFQLHVGEARAAAGQWKLAIDSYERVAAQWPETPLADWAEFQVAECWARLGEAARASELFWNIVDKDPYGELLPAAMLRLADIELRQGRVTPARALYDDINRTHAGATRAHALQGLGLIEYRANRFGPALSFFELALTSCPTSAVADRASYLQAWCRFHLHQEDEALSAFQAFAQRYPNSVWAPDALFWVSEYEYNHGHYDRAETGFLRAQQRYPQAALADAALFWAGRAALLQNEFRRANNHFALLIKDYPGSTRRPEARFYQAAAVCELGEFAAAILIFDELVKQFPNHELTLTASFRKGDCQFALGSEDPKRYDEALGSYQGILDRPELTPAARLQAEYKIGRCLEKTGKRPEAFEHYMNAVYLYYKIAEPRPEDTVWFTRAAFQAAALKEAEKSWRQAAAIYRRVADAEVPSGSEAAERIKRLRSEHWLNFY